MRLAVHRRGTGRGFVLCILVQRCALRRFKLVAQTLSPFLLLLRLRPQRTRAIPRLLRLTPGALTQGEGNVADGENVGIGGRPDLLVLAELELDPFVAVSHTALAREGPPIAGGGRRVARGERRAGSEQPDPVIHRSHQLSLLTSKHFATSAPTAVSLSLARYSQRRRRSIPAGAGQTSRVWNGVVTHVPAAHTTSTQTTRC